MVGLRDQSGNGFRFDAYDNYRDVALLTECDSAVRALAETAGWLEDLDSLIRLQREAHFSSGRSASEASSVEEEIAPKCKLPTSLLKRSWRRQFRADLPKLLPLGDGSNLSSQQDTETDVTIFVKNRAGSLEQIDGGEVLEVTIAQRWSAAEAWERMCFAFVPSGSKSPEKAFECVSVKFPVQDNSPRESGPVSIMVPPLRKSQIEKGEVASYELWFMGERSCDCGQLEGAALARAGPIRTVANSEGVAVANSFARLAVRGALAEHNAKSSDNAQGC